ncbi:hypothetical protein DESC_610045 [Desulfosarcina cetonica]|nr:hypothetical protein DESC_610045 [Desulfosarcina cetonica]
MGRVGGGLRYQKGSLVDHRGPGHVLQGAPDAGDLQTSPVLPFRRGTVFDGHRQESPLQGETKGRDRNAGGIVRKSVVDLIHLQLSIRIIVAIKETMQ